MPERPAGRFRRNVIVTLGIQALILLAAMAQGALVARTLGPEGKGILAVAMLVAPLLAQVLGGGISISATYFAGSRRISVPQLTGHSVTFSLMGTLAAAALALAGFQLMAPGTSVLGVAPELLLLAVAGVPLVILTRALAGILHGQRRILTVNALQLLSVLVMLAFTYLFLVRAGWGEPSVLTAWLLGLVAMTLVTAALLRKQGGKLLPAWETKTVLKLISFGARSQVAALFYLFALRLDIFLIAYFLAPAEVGIYSVSVRLAELLWHLPTAVSFVIVPIAARSSRKQMNALTPRALSWTLGLTAVGAVALSLIGRPLIRFVFTDAFSDAYLPLLLLLPGIVLMGGVQILINEIIGRGSPHFSSLIAGVSLVLIVALDLWLIPAYGINGAAIASSIAYSLSFAFAMLVYLKVSRRRGSDEPQGDESLLQTQMPSAGV